MTSALSSFSVLDNFCQIARVVHLICKAHIHILLFDSKFHIILARYVQMLDIHIEKIRYFKKYHNIFQPCDMPLKVIEVGTIHKPVCDFLLVINSN